MERRKFEESWKEAFDQAEIGPSENVWTNIELDLEKAKASQLKRRLVFYQMLAAASVVFAMSIGLGVYVNSGNKPDQTLATQQVTPAASDPGKAAQAPENNRATSRNPDEEQNTSSSQKPEADLVAGTASQNNDQGKNRNEEKESGPIAGKAAPGLDQQRPADQSRKYHDNRQQEQNTGRNIANAAEQDKAQGLMAENTDRLNKANESAANPETIPVSAADRQDKTALSRAEEESVITSKEKNASAVFAPSFERKLPELVAQRKIEFILPEEEKADPVALMLAKLEQREQEVRAQEEKKKDEKNKGEKLWTSVGFAAGSFDPVVSRNPAPPVASLAAGSFASNASKEVGAKGATYSMGVNMGTRLSDRWVLQGGVNYLTQTSDYTQNGLVPSGGPDNTLKLPSNFKDETQMHSAEGDIRQSVVDTPPYNVNNNVRYLSVPMQAGYMIINKDFGFQLNAGVSTDLLLQNTITATVDGEAVESDFEGNDYRQVNLSGLMGTELSYRFGRRYRIALNPGLRYPFSNIYKSEDFRATRLSFDVGLRFRYIFH